jgi:8-oxo-dGTP diphosphatase
MRVIEVVATILQRDGAYFATQRGYGEFEGMWEFPGGKIEPGESPEVALKREIQEELSIDITIDKFLCTTEYDYPSFHLTMHCFLCTLISESMHLNEHEDAAWLSAETLYSVKWLPADEGLIPKIAADLA